MLRRWPRGVFFLFFFFLFFFFFKFLFVRIVWCCDVPQAGKERDVASGPREEKGIGPLEVAGPSHFCGWL